MDLETQTPSNWCVDRVEQFTIKTNLNDKDTKGCTPKCPNCYEG